VLERWRNGDIDFVASKATLREAELVLGAGWLARVTGSEKVQQLLEELRDGSVVVEPVSLPLNLKDRGDRDLVEAAVSAKANFVVTADREVLRMRGYDSVEFLSPGEALARLQHG
jgi:predicted nucleic acid-binding protein